jgi:hypothetical protein
MRRKRRSETRLLEAHVVSMRIKKRLLSASERKTFFVVKESLYQHLFTKTLNNFLCVFVQKIRRHARKKKEMEAANEAKEAARKRARALLPWYAKMWLTCTCR